MTEQDAHSYLHYLLTLHLRQEEAFGPLALSFIKEQDLSALGLSPEEQFNLNMATAQSFAAEPKRYTLKLELLRKALHLLPQTRYDDPELARDLAYDIKKIQADLAMYAEAMKTPRVQGIDRQLFIVETEIPEYFLNIAQKRAATYYQQKYHLSKEAKTAQPFSQAPKRFDPNNPAIQKEFPGACAPFMSARTNAFHLMLPFDIKISRSPEDPLEAGIRIFYAKLGYSFPLRYEMGKLCNYHDGQVLDIALNDPHLLFFSVSGIKDPDFHFQPAPTDPNIPPELTFPLSVLEGLGSLGPYLQISCKFKIWFDASMVSLLIQGAPDLHEYGLQGGSGLMTRTYASDTVESYAHMAAEPWQEGLSFNFVNMHLQLGLERQMAHVPHSTPIFTVYPVFNRQCYRFEDRHRLVMD